LQHSENSDENAGATVSARYGTFGWHTRVFVLGRCLARAGMEPVACAVPESERRDIEAQSPVAHRPGSVSNSRQCQKPAYWASRSRTMFGGSERFRSPAGFYTPRIDYAKVVRGELTAKDAAAHRHIARDVDNAKNCVNVRPNGRMADLEPRLTTQKIMSYLKIRLVTPERRRCGDFVKTVLASMPAS
jgi:hypothetical protein